MSIPRYHLVSTVLASATQRSLCLPIGHSFNLLRCPKLSAFGGRGRTTTVEKCKPSKLRRTDVQLKFIIFPATQFILPPPTANSYLLPLPFSFWQMILFRILSDLNVHSTPPSLSGDLINWLQCIVNYTAERPLLSEFYPVYWFPFTARLDQTSVTETPSVVVVVCKDVTGWWWFVLLGRLW